MPACTIGCWIPSRRVSAVVSISASSCAAGWPPVAFVRLKAGGGSCEEGRGRAIIEGQVHHLRALQLLPVVAVGGAVVEVALVLDRAPVGVVGLEQDRLGLFDFRRSGAMARVIGSIWAG